MKENFKSGFVSVIGRPNVGKSTLLNQIIGRKLLIMSDKPQTTRNRIQVIKTTENAQVIFIDTPGIHKPRHLLGDYMNKAAISALGGVDLIIWIVEPDDYIGGGDRHIIDIIKGLKTPVILIINKIDLVAKEKILSVIETYKEAHPFKEIIPVSALKNENTENLFSIIKSYLPEGPKYFPDYMITDQPERQIIAEIIREKTLMLLRDEIPHGLAVVIDSFQELEDKNMVHIDATIVTEKKSHKPIILGKNGSMIKEIGIRSRKEIEKFLGIHIRLDLWVKVKERWRNNDFLLKNYGYNKKDMD